MKKYTFILMTLVSSVCFLLAFNKASQSNLIFPNGRNKEKMPLEQKIEGRAYERDRQLININNNKVNPEDWYNALNEILNRKSSLATRGGELPWESMGPDQVGGRTLGFVFDKTKESRCYAGGASGGIFVSNDLGFSWNPVPNLDIDLNVLPIGCMKQSIDGDIYAGTGEYWTGNSPGGNGASSFFGAGIYKKLANEDEFKILLSTYDPLKKNTAGGQLNFKFVVDIACHPKDNNTLYAATNNGLQVSTNGGQSFSAVKGSPLSSNFCSQIEAVLDDQNQLILYAGYGGQVYKSKDEGLNWSNITPLYKSDANQNMRIAVSKKDANKVYVCGIDNKFDFKYMIRSIDGGNSWTPIGKKDALTNPLCSGTTCQGHYDLTMDIHPYNDDMIFFGGMQKLYMWSVNTGWVNISDWQATEGLNKVHSDMHEFAFHPTHPDTMVVCTDGGIFMSYNSYSNATASKWIPRNTNYNVTQCYDVQASMYGELIGGAQDNGTNLIALRGTSIGGSIEVSGGDGFESAFSAQDDYQVVFSTVYSGSLSRAASLTANRSSIAKGSCADMDNKGTGDGNIDSVGFYTKIHLAESIIPMQSDPTKDSVELSFLFAFSGGQEQKPPFSQFPGGFFISTNATATNSPTKWTQRYDKGIGEINSMHHSPNLSVAYMAGDLGVLKVSGLRTAVFSDVNTTFDFGISGKVQKLCPSPTGITYTKATGVSGSGKISGIYVDQKDDNHVIATAMEFGGTAKVFESTNGSSFVSKQGDLPIMPVYCCAIDPEDSKHVIIGTEFGLWETDDISAASPKWIQQIKNIGRVPVFKMRVKKLRVEGCNVLYVGSHGRGFWRVPFPLKSSCDYTAKARKLVGSIQPFSNIESKFEIYPNPCTDIIKVSFHSEGAFNTYLTIYDMQGRLVKKETFRALPGNNVTSTDVSSLYNGSYVVRLEDDNNVIGGKILQKQ